MRGVVQHTPEQKTAYSPNIRNIQISGIRAIGFCIKGLIMPTEKDQLTQDTLASLLSKYYDEHPLGLRPGMSIEEAENCARKTIEERLNANMGTRGLIKVTQVKLEKGPIMPISSELCEKILKYFQDAEGIIQTGAKEAYKIGGPEAVEKYADRLVRAGIVSRSE